MTLFTAKNVVIFWKRNFDRPGNWMLVYQGPSETYSVIEEMDHRIPKDYPDENLLLEAMHILKRDGLKMGTENVEIHRG
jgi:hypothetical protein